MAQDEEEVECIQQNTARQLLERMEVEMADLRRAQARGEAPPPDHPEEAAIERGIISRMEILRKESKRPATDRIPITATPPRQVLRTVATKLCMGPEDPPTGSYVGGNINSNLSMQVLRILDAKDNGRRNSSQQLVFCLTLSNGVPSFSSAGTSVSRQCAVVDWTKEMGSWSIENWAWLLAALLTRTGWPIGGILLNYKLQDCPQLDFQERVMERFRDLTFTERYNSNLERYRDHIFYEANCDGNYVADMMVDLAYMFDSSMWLTACEVGMEVEDRTRRPALTFLVKGETVLDCYGKRWRSQEEYVKHRLRTADVHESLSSDEVEKHIEFLWDVLESQKIKELSPEDNNFVRSYEIYQEYAEKKLGKTLRKVARKHNMSIPDQAMARTRNLIRCDHCNKLEGTATDSEGNVITRFRQCPCNPDGHPYYCQEKCQTADWPSHKEFCTANATSSTSSTKKKSSSSSSGGKKKSSSKTKKKKKR